MTLRAHQFYSLNYCKNEIYLYDTFSLTIGELHFGNLAQFRWLGHTSVFTFQPSTLYSIVTALTRYLPTMEKACYAYGSPSSVGGQSTVTIERSPPSELCHSLVTCQHVRYQFCGDEKGTCRSCSHANRVKGLPSSLCNCDISSSERKTRSVSNRNSNYLF